MYIRIVSPYRKWIPGNVVDVTNEFGRQLVLRGVAVPTTQNEMPELPPKKEDENVVYHVHTWAEDEPQEEGERKPPKTAKKII